MKNICVYCGSSNDVDVVYKDAAAELGAMLADAGLGVVYGGGHVGLMGILADAALERGGTVVGVIPHHIATTEVLHTDLTELHVVETMHERKAMLVERSDAFVILPGGLGTMDEFFEVLTWWKLRLHDKPIVLVNVAGYWDPLVALLKRILDCHFATAGHLDHLTVIDRVSDLPATLDQAPREKSGPQTKWI